MRKVFILLNKLSEFDFREELSIYLKDCHVDIGTWLPFSPNDYDIIVAWCYKTIIKNIPNPNNIIIFHSSNLPEGKGWAPIYNAIVNEQQFYVISGILASQDVDSGDIVVKAKFKIKSEYMAKDIRLFDKKISLFLIHRILEKFKIGTINGVMQSGNGSYNKRRHLEDNEININSTFASLIPHFRACEDDAPPYFYYKDIRYNLAISPDIAIDSSLPSDLKITFLID